jgi:hypothetical protein
MICVYIKLYGVYGVIYTCVSYVSPYYIMYIYDISLYVFIILKFLNL